MHSRLPITPSLFARRRAFVLAGTITTLLFAGLGLDESHADSGTWINASGDGFWSEPTNWFDSIVADGLDFTANFSTLNLVETNSVHLDTPRTIGGLLFDDTTPSHDWVIDNNSTPGNILTLAVSAGSPSIAVLNQNATISASIAGIAGFTKTGSGTLILSGANNYTGAALISSGSVTITGTGTHGGYRAGGATDTGILTINSSGNLTFPGVPFGADGFNSIGGIPGTDSTTGAGAVIHTAGNVTVGSGSGYVELGTDTANRSTYGAYTLAGGTLTTSGAAGNGSGMRVGAGGFGVFTQTGGTLNMNRFFVAGSGGGTGNTGAGSGVITLSGGTANILTAAGNQRGIILGDRGNCTGVLNIGTLAGGNATLNNSDTNGVRTGAFAAATGIVNLNSGTVNFNSARGFQRPNGTATGVVNLNGGTLRAGVGNVAMIETSLSSVNVYRGGVTIDTQANSATIPAALLAAGGNGLYPAGGSLTVPTDNGAGYIGAPVVTVSGGSGAGLMAVANITNGSVTGVTLTSPGQNYQVGDTVSFVFDGGGATTTANTFNYLLTASDLAVNSTGGLTKIGSGTLTLGGTNTYTGTTTVSNGTLIVTGSIAGSTTELNGGTVGGTGTIGPVNVNAGGILSPGDTAGQISPLATGSINFLTSATLRIEVASLTSDQINVTGPADLDGTVTLDLSLTAQPTFGTVFTIVNSTGGITGYLDGGRLSYAGNVLEEGETFLATTGAFSQQFTISYAADSGNDITLAAVPEPSCATALLGGLGLIAGILRRRRPLA